jgi:DNA-3-methyladenine glycosylase
MTEPVLVNQTFLLRDDVVAIARELIGMLLIVKNQSVVKAGIIAETEAYAGITDKASHAYGGRRTIRTETLYRAGGTVYVYLCYGVHHLFNIVTNQENIPHAVLIRGILPVNEKAIPENFRDEFEAWKGIANGPGKLTKKLGIRASHNASMLNSDAIWLYKFPEYHPVEIVKTSRIGVDYAGEDAYLPYRFYARQYKPAKI